VTDDANKPSQIVRIKLIIGSSWLPQELAVGALSKITPCVGFHD